MYIGLGSESDFSLSWYGRGSFFASFFTVLGLASSSLLEGISGELLVFHNLRSYVISRADGGRHDFNTWKEVHQQKKFHSMYMTLCFLKEVVWLVTPIPPSPLEGSDFATSLEVPSRSREDWYNVNHGDPEQHREAGHMATVVKNDNSSTNS